MMIWTIKMLDRIQSYRDKMQRHPIPQSHHRLASYRPHPTQSHSQRYIWEHSKWSQCRTRVLCRTVVHLHRLPFQRNHSHANYFPSRNCSKIIFTVKLKRTEYKKFRRNQPSNQSAHCLFRYAQIILKICCFYMNLIHGLCAIYKRNASWNWNICLNCGTVHEAVFGWIVLLLSRQHS